MFKVFVLRILPPPQDTLLVSAVHTKCCANRMTVAKDILFSTVFGILRTAFWSGKYNKIFINLVEIYSSPEMMLHAKSSVNQTTVAKDIQFWDFLGPYSGL